MSQQEKNAYVLGTEQAELHRLGFQHQVWASEARRGWETAEFGYGQTILDLGCGPGFATIDLAYLVGPSGKVIAVDKSQNYIDQVEALAKDHKLDNIETICCDFADLELEESSVDRIYHRWALAWMGKVDKIIEKMYRALKPEGVIVSQEYFDWSTLQLEPSGEAWEIAKKATLKSFKQYNAGDIDIGRFLPKMFEEQGFKVVLQRPMSKLARPHDLQWEWPATFFKLYFPKVAEMGFMTKEECNNALKEFNDLSGLKDTVLLTPTMIEIVSKKV